MDPEVLAVLRRVAEILQTPHEVGESMTIYPETFTLSVGYGQDGLVMIRVIINLGRPVELVPVSIVVHDARNTYKGDLELGGRFSLIGSFTVHGQHWFEVILPEVLA